MSEEFVRVAGCSCAVNRDGSVHTSMCPIHADTDPCYTMASITGRRRRGSIVRGVCTNCGHGGIAPAEPIASDEEFFVAAEAPPIGVQLWPTRAPEFAPNWTVASVAVDGQRVTWTYEGGGLRHFRVGERVYCRGDAKRAAAVIAAIARDGELTEIEEAIASAAFLEVTGVAA